MRLDLTREQIEHNRQGKGVLTFGVQYVFVEVLLPVKIVVNAIAVPTVDVATNGSFVYFEGL